MYSAVKLVHNDLQQGAHGLCSPLQERLKHLEASQHDRTARSNLEHPRKQAFKHGPPAAMLNNLSEHLERADWLLRMQRVLHLANDSRVNCVTACNCTATAMLLLESHLTLNCCGRQCRTCF